MKITVKTKLERGAALPAYATPGSAAVDLRAALEGGKRLLLPGQRCMIPTGLFIEPESGEPVVSIVAARSGLAAKSGICLANGIGVIDQDYRGEITVALLNTSDKPFTVNDGERIAQLFFLPVVLADFIESEALGSTQRGEGGFGSTGVK